MMGKVDDGLRFVVISARPSDRNPGYITIEAFDPDWPTWGLQRGRTFDGEDFPVIEYTYQPSDVIRLTYEHAWAWLPNGDGWPSGMHINDGPEILLRFNVVRARHELYIPPAEQHGDGEPSSGTSKTGCLDGAAE